MKSTLSISIKFISIIIVSVCCLTCGKPKQNRYSFLNSELNKNVPIANADLRIHDFERWANWIGVGIETSSKPTMELRLVKAQAKLTDEGILMTAHVDVFPALFDLWVEKSTMEERVQDCKRLGNKVANELSKFLECDPSLITIDIRSSAELIIIPPFKAQPISAEDGAEQPATSQ